jgi:ABC-type transport system involved in cytochrome bd biosynthesis fused ATPase/permease subunit
VLIVVLGLWPRTSGDLHLNGVSFDDLDHDDVRRSIGSHLSSSSLFSGTVRSNLEMTGASSDEMRRVLDAVGLPPEVFLDRQLGERGRGLSGGEQLRVSIARALLSGRHAVVIDEPFAQLDEFSARQVERAIVDFARGRTIITTAHERGNDSVDVVVDLSSGR